MTVKRFAASPYEGTGPIMELLFLLCAVFGVTVLVAQFFLGFGGDEPGGEGPEDTPDGIDGLEGDAGDAGDLHHDSTWVFGVLTFRTVLIGATFFGLIGKAMLASGFDTGRALGAAVVGGLAAMYGVYFLMRGLYRLTADGTERISRSVGEEARVYLTIPGHNQGVGKIHVTVQNRTIEYEAITAGERLPTGARAVVIGVLGSDRVEVAPLAATGEPNDVNKAAGQSHA
jgi:hypothetical protein